MNYPNHAVIYISDANLARRLRAHLESLAELTAASTPDECYAWLARMGPSLLLTDLTAPDVMRLIARIRREQPETLIIAFGVRDSDPALQAEALGVYAIESPDIDRRMLHNLARHALAQIRLQKENTILQQTLARQATDTPIPPPQNRRYALHLHFSAALRNFADFDSVCQQIAPALAAVSGSARAGIFLKTIEQTEYRFKAGVECLPQTDAIAIEVGHPAIIWMQNHACMIMRDTLKHITTPDECLMLQTQLDILGAEAIVPLKQQPHISGFFFIGRKTTASPMNSDERELLTSLAEHVSILLENSWYHARITEQNMLSADVIDSLPTGIIAADQRHNIRICNPAAARILARPAAEILNKSINNISSRLEHLLIETFAGKPTPSATIFRDKLSRLETSVTTCQIKHANRDIGALALIRDITEDSRNRARQTEQDQASYWIELAAALSHEVRNPLVAISTFAQLLPDRYSDAEFREKFSTLVDREVNRINALVSRIHDFANPVEAPFERLKLKKVINKAITSARKTVSDKKIKIKLSIQPDMPDIMGDEDALITALANLIINAMEALHNTEKPHIDITAAFTGMADNTLQIRISDNGPGIPPELKDNLLSPFSSGKARGIGLGIPVAHRVITRHNGELKITSDRSGTDIAIVLPTLPTQKPESGECET